MVAGEHCSMGDAMATQLYGPLVHIAPARPICAFVQVRLAKTRRRATEGLFERSAREGAQGFDYAGITSSRAVFGQ